MFIHLPQSNPSPRTKSQKQTTSVASAAAPRQQTPLPPSRVIPSSWGPSFANPEILGDPPEDDFQLEVDNPKLDSRYTGICDKEPEDPECLNSDVIKKMEFRQRAMWLGRWFGLHYAAWVEDFDMKELRSYEMNEETLRDSLVGPLAALCWTFRRFRLPDNEWRGPAFCSPVQYPLF